MRLINVEDIPAESIIAQDVYSSSGTMLIREGAKVTERMKTILENQSIYSVYITDEKTEQIKEELSLEEDFELKDIIDPRLRRSFNHALKDSLNTFKKAKGLSRYSEEGASLMREIESIAKTIIDEVLLKKDRHITLVDVKHLDIYEYEHAVNTAILAVVTGSSFGLTEQELMDMAQGALLMNISKELLKELLEEQAIEEAEQEENIYRSHPEVSKRLLSDNTLANAHIKNIVLKHHERMDGSGYPLGLKSEEIDLLTKIVMIADVYDEMTSNQKHRRAYSPNDALEYIMAASHLFDYKSAYVFSRQIVPYPPGDLVELNNGAIGLVLSSNEMLPLRPVIRIMSGNQVNEIIDLKKTYNMVILKRVTAY